jgi:hypothetical protein
MSTAIPGSITIDLTAHGSLRRLERLAWFSDSAIRIPGTRRTFGADGLLNIIPHVGSLARTGLSLCVLAEAMHHRDSSRLLARVGPRAVPRWRNQVFTAVILKDVKCLGAGTGALGDLHATARETQNETQAENRHLAGERETAATN